MALFLCLNLRSDPIIVIQLTNVSFFSGIGELGLATEAEGLETVCQCEWAGYPYFVLQKHWPDVLKLRDITTFTKGLF